MLKKLRILSSNIPKEYNEGFIIDYNKNKIINISKNFSIRIPFKMIKSNIFNFELLIENSSVNLNFILNTEFIKNNSYDIDYLKNKNYIFSILRCSFKNRELNNDINRFFDLKDIISKKANYILKDNIIVLNNLYFNLEKESIIPADNDNSVYLKPKLYLIYGIINNYNKPKDYKLCIVDDIYKLDQSNIVISRDNYTSIKLDQLYSNDTIGICKKFFLSNEYIKMYKYFHSNYRSKFAFDNFKTYVEDIDDMNYNLYNIEMLDNYIFILNNIPKKSLIKHPIINSNNYTLIINKKVTEDDVKNSYKLLNYKYKSSHINTDIIMNNQIYYDRNKFLLSKLFDKYPTVIKRKFLLKDIIDNFSTYKTEILSECPITRENICKNAYIKLDCGHIFTYNGIDNYISYNMKCPYCSKDIKSGQISFYKKHILNQILERDDISDKDVYFFYKDTNKFIEFISNECFSSIKIENEMINIEIEPGSILVLDININKYDFSNLIVSNLDILDTIELIKFDFYY